MGIRGFKWIKRANKANAFENNKTEEHEIYYSRYIASWYLAGGHLDNLTDTINFKEWLRSTGIEDEKVIWAISNMAVCGKVELVQSAREFINEMQEEL